MCRALPLLLALGGCHWVLPHGPQPVGDRAVDQSAQRTERPAADAARVPDRRVDAPAPPDVPRPDAPLPDVKAKKEGLVQPTCTCPIGLTCCLELGPCVDTAKDPNHCGGCGQACEPGLSCVAGVCTGCSASTCAGCCDANGNCSTGNSPVFCAPSGLAGEACGICPVVPATGCTLSLCIGGLCSEAPKPNGTSCDDQNACTTAESCKSGSCVGLAKTCTGPALPCKVYGCIPATGLCGYTNAKAGTACTIDCMTGTTCDGAGKCVGGVQAPNGTTCPNGIGSCCEGICCSFQCCPGEPGGPCKSACN
jgi:hypothetical protein